MVTRTELIKIVDLVAAAWNIQQRPDEHSRMVKAWWRYLQDLDYGDALNVIDRLVVRATYIPKVGEVRRLILDSTDPAGFPAPGEAWAQASDRVRSLEQGTEWVDVHPLVATTMRRAGMDGRGRADQRVFATAYDDVLRAAEEDRLLPELPEPFGDMP